MKLNKDQRRVINGSVAYYAGAITVFSVDHLIKGDFEWVDALIYAAIMAVVCLLIALFFVIGMKVPKKDDKSNPVE